MTYSHMTKMTGESTCWPPEQLMRDDCCAYGARGDGDAEGPDTNTNAAVNVSDVDLGDKPILRAVDV